MGENNIVVDACVLDLSGVDMILSLAWLETLEKVEMDWKAMYISFQSENGIVKLQGVRDYNSNEDESDISAGSLLGFCGRLRVTRM